MKYRAIQANVPQSESLASVSDFAERLYWRMLAVTDSWGRLPGSAGKVKALCAPLIPASKVEVDAALTELEQVGRIQIYAGTDERGAETRVCQIVDFDMNQPPEFLRRRAKQSGFSDPPKRARTDNTPATKPRDLQDTPGVVGSTLANEGSRSRSTTPQREQSAAALSSLAPQGGRKRDELWDELAHHLGEPATRSERGKRNDAVKQLRDVGATPDEVRLRSARYRERWPQVSLTDQALVKHWTQLGREEPANGRTLRYGRGMTTAAILEGIGEGTSRPSTSERKEIGP